MTQARSVLANPRLAWSRTAASVRRPATHDLLRSPLAAAALGWVVVRLLAEPELYWYVLLAVVAIPAAVATWRHPFGALVAVVAVVPFVQLLQSFLWTEGILDASTAIRLAYVKEIVLLVVLVRAVQRRPPVLPTVDRFAVGFGALTALYLVLPLGPPLEARYVSARSAAGFAVVLLAARWLPFPTRVRERVPPLLLPGVAVVAALGVWNRWNPEGWTGWVADVGLLRFRTEVLEAFSYQAVERVADGTGTRVRAGSIFFSPNDLGYFCLIAVAVVLARMAQRRTHAWEPAVLVVCLLALYYAGSRSAMGLVLLAGLASAVIVRGVAGRAGAVLLSGGAVLFLVVGLGAGSLLASGVDAENESTSQHIEALGTGIVRVASHPFGSGLGTASSNAIRFDVEGRLENTENFYVLVGAQMGIVGMVLVIGLVAATLRALLRKARDGDVVAAPAFAAVAAVAAGGLVLDTLTAIEISWLVGLLAGLGLHGPLEPGRRSA